MNTMITTHTAPATTHTTPATINTVALFANNHCVGTVPTTLDIRPGTVIKWRNQLWRVSSTSSHDGVRRIIARLTYVA